ncbi:MAG: hypothetical protein WHV44_06710 [Anaerolineales bacterium]
MLNPLRDTDWLWLGLTLFVVVSIAFLLPVVPNDYWWYLRLGQDILSTGRVPSVDTYSVPQFGQPLVYQSWLSAVLMWGMYHLGGIPLTVLARGVALAVTYGLLWRLAVSAGLGRRLSAVLVIAAALAVAGNWSVRPQLFAYPLFVISVWVLLGWQGGRTRLAWLLPVLSWLWTGLHGSFPLLFALMAAALVFGRGDRKALLAAVALAGLASLMHPRGLALWQNIGATFTDTVARDFSAEWLPTTNTGWQMNLFFAWFIALVPLAAFSPCKPSLMEWAWFVGFAWLGFSGIRYVIWLLFIMTLITARLLSAWPLPQRPSPAPKLDWAIGVMLMLLPLAVLPGVRERWWAQSPPQVANTPVAAVDWLRNHPDLPGPLWSDIVFASYQIFALPERPVWIDTRFQVAFTAEQIARYKTVAHAEPGWEDVLNADGINLMMLSHEDQDALIPLLEISPVWCMRYRDEVAVIFSRAPVGQPCP